MHSDSASKAKESKEKVIQMSDNTDGSRPQDSTRFVGPSPEPLGTDRQRALVRAMDRRCPQVTPLYRGALAALRDVSNPDRLAQAAHSMREAVEKLPAFLGVVVSRDQVIRSRSTTRKPSKDRQSLLVSRPSIRLLSAPSRKTSF